MINHLMKRKGLTRKLIAAIIAMVTVVTICGCGQEAGNSYASIQIGKKSYDLTEDVEKIISDFGTDGYYVAITTSTVDRTENAYRCVMIFPDGTAKDMNADAYELLPDRDTYYRMDIVCRSFIEPPTYETDRILASAKTYMFYGYEDTDWPVRWNGSFLLGSDILEEYSVRGIDEIYGTKECEEKLRQKGINSLKELNKNCRLKNYHTVTTFSGGGFVLVALYFDGEPVDLYSYYPENIIDEWNACDYMQYGLRQKLPLYTTFPYIMDGPVRTKSDYCDFNWESIGIECAYDKAYQDGAEKIAAGELSEVVAVCLSERRVEVIVMKKDDSILLYDPKLDSLYFSKD